MTGHTLLAFRWMAGRARQWHKRSERAVDRRHMEQDALVSSAFSECANCLKVHAEMPLAEVTAKLARTSGPNGLAEIIGKWPGTETDEEIEAALRQLDPGEGSP